MRKKQCKWRRGFSLTRCWQAQIAIESEGTGIKWSFLLKFCFTQRALRNAETQRILGVFAGLIVPACRPCFAVATRRRRRQVCVKPHFAPVIFHSPSGTFALVSWPLPFYVCTRRWSISNINEKPENPTNPKKPTRSASISKPSQKKLKGHRLNGGLF